MEENVGTLKRIKIFIDVFKAKGGRPNIFSVWYKKVCLHIYGSDLFILKSNNHHFSG